MREKSGLGSRRSQRVSLCVPIVISGSETGTRLTFERTYTITLSRHGGLIALRANVRPGQNLLLTNSATHESTECRVVYLGSNQTDKRQVAIEFTDPAADFWNLSTAVSDSKSARE